MTRFFSLMAGLLALLSSVIAVAEEAVPAFGSTVDVATLGSEPLRLGDDLVYLADPGHRFTADALLAGAAPPHWTKSATEYPNLGLSVPPHWFAVGLRNQGDEARRLLLVMPYTLMDYLDVYVARDGRAVRVAQTGDQRPFATRPVAHRAFLIPLTVPAHSQLQLLLRAESDGAMELPLELWQPEDFFQQDQAAFAAQLVFVGLMLGLAIYNIFLLVGTRDRSYLWYVLSITTITFVVLSFHGVLAQFAWPHWPALNNYVLVGAIGLNILAASLFAYRFLDLKRFGRPLRYLILGHAAIGAVIFLLNFFLPYSATVRLAALFAVTGSLACIVIALYLCFRGEILARFYIGAWIGLLCGSVAITLLHMALLPPLPILKYGQQFGAAIEGLLLSFALAYRINMERQQRYLAQADVLRLQREANEVLELRVQERTAALEEANRKLQEVSATDGLPQVRNRHFFEQKLVQEWSKNSRANSRISLVMIDGDHFKRINDNHGHLCGDACLQHLARIFQTAVHRAGDCVARYGGEEFVLLLSHTDLDSAALVAERIRRTVEASPMAWEGQKLQLTVSIGVSCRQPRPDGDVKELVREADAALYEAKNRGRNRVMVHRQADDGSACIAPWSASDTATAQNISTGQ